MIKAERDILIRFRRATEHQQIPPLHWSGKERMHCAVKPGERRFHEIMLNGPEKFAVGVEKSVMERLGARLGGTEMQTYGCGCDIANRGSEHHIAPCIRLCPFGVGIENHHIPDAEISH